MDLNIIKINDKTYLILDKNKKNHFFTIPQIKSPFGIEKFNNISYLNLELDSSHYELYNDIIKIDKYFCEYVKNIDKNIEWVCSTRKKESYLPLWKIRIPKKNNKYLVKFENKLKSGITLSECNFKDYMNIKVNLNSLWIYNNKAGLVWNLEEAYFNS